jgi:hypothetical protein
MNLAHTNHCKIHKICPYFPSFIVQQALKCSISDKCIGKKTQIMQLNVCSFAYIQITKTQPKLQTCIDERPHWHVVMPANCLIFEKGSKLQNCSTFSSCLNTQQKQIIKHRSTQSKTSITDVLFIKCKIIYKNVVVSKYSKNIILEVP